MKKLLAIFPIFGFLLIAFIAQADTRIIAVTVENPDGPLSQAAATFFIPFGVTPVDLTSASSWDETRRELKINLGSFKERESKAIEFILEGEPGRYLLSGKLSGVWPAVNNRPAEIFEEAVPAFPVFIGEEDVPGIGEFFRNLQNIPELVQIADTISKPISVVLGAAGAGAMVNSAVSASASFAAGLSKILSYLGLGFLRIRRKKPWGKVYNHLTGKPIEGAAVEVIDTQFKKVKQTGLTDSEGRFGFLIAHGEYYLKVSHRGFATKETQPIKVFGQAQTLNLEVALEPMQGELKPASYRALKFWRFFSDLFARVSAWLLVIGVLLSVVNVLVVPSLASYIIVGVYALLVVLKIILRETFFKSFGWVLDKNTNHPLSLSVVRIFDVNKNWLLGTRVTDEAGRFNFLIGPGDYYVTAAKEGYKPFQSAQVHFTKSGLISYDIKLEKA